MRTDTVDLDHFERLYARSADPWGFGSRPYELAKYAVTMKALPRARYARGFDVGCSIGVLTAALAERCDDLLAVEPVEAALAQARARNAARPWVRFANLFVPGDWPAETFDLIVISEVIDYLGEADLALLAGRLRASVADGGDVVLVHWIGKKRGPPSAAEATDVLTGLAADCLGIVHAQRNADYRLDVLRRH